MREEQPAGWFLEKDPRLRQAERVSFADYLDAKEILEDEDAGKFGDRLKKAWKKVKRAGKKVAHGIQKGLHVITDNPLWDMAQTGASFIPGIGSAVSAGMASAAAIGKGKSLADVGLAAARGALPGGAMTQAAFDIGVGALKGKRLDKVALGAIRRQLPGGPMAKGAFDAAIATIEGAKPHELDRARKSLDPSARSAFDAAVQAAARKTGGKLSGHKKGFYNRPSASWAALGKLARQKVREKNAKKGRKAPVIDARKQRQLRDLKRLAALSPEKKKELREYVKAVKAARHKARRGKLHRRTVPLMRRAHTTGSQRRFADLSPTANKAADAIAATRVMRAKNANDLAKAMGVSTEEARKAIAAFLKRYVERLDWRDVGDLDRLDQVAERHGVQLPQDLDEVEDGELDVVVMPAVPVSRPWLQRLFDAGGAEIRRAIQAHELLAHMARDTGELDGRGGWVIRAGDYPYKVAQTVTGDANRWREISSANPDMTVYTDSAGRTQLKGWTVGKRIQLPPSWVPSSVGDEEPAEPGEDEAHVEASDGGPPFSAPSEYPQGYPSRTYLVKKGDTGIKVAEKITGDGTRWRELLKVNPTLASEKYGIALYAGKRINLPPAWIKRSPTPEAIAAEHESELEKHVDKEAPAAEMPAAPSPVAPQPKVVSPVPAPMVPSAPVAPHPTAPSSPSVPAPAPEPEHDVEPEPVVTGSQEQIATVQVMLGFFFQKHPEATWTLPEAPFGSIPDDYAGKWNERSTEALEAFQKWWNKAGKKPELEEDGLPDEETLVALRASVDANLGISTPAPKAMPATPAPAKSGPVKPANPQAPTAPPPRKHGGSSAAPLALAALGLGYFLL